MRMFRNPFSLRPPKAFTLVELIISIGMVLILMAGVVKVFKYATDAVGAGLAVSDIVRVQRSLNGLISTDPQGDFQYLSSSTTKCPAILLDSQQNTVPLPWPGSFTPGTPNTISQAGSNLATVQGPIFLDKNAEAKYQSLLPSDVQFRQDTFSFFAKGTFARQTGNGGQLGISGGTFVSSMTSNWAWIWYGQLWLPDNSATFHPNAAADTTSTYPGCGTSASNPNNFYARQWQFGRTPMLLLPKNTRVTLPGTTPTDVFSGYWPGTTNKRFQSFIQEQVLLPAAPPPIPTLQPLGFGSQSRDLQDANNQTTLAPLQGGWVVQNSRYDLAGVTASSGDPFNDYIIPRLNSAAANFVPSWMVPVTASNMAALTDLSLNYRFQANPYPVRSTAANQPALSSSQVALTVPSLAPGCVRFYVEYAGDFLNQDQRPGPTYGNVNSDFTTLGFVPDGTDFYIDGNGARHIRWYGLPRDTSGDGLTNTVTSYKTSQNVQDVFPLAYFLSGSSSPTTHAPWEQFPVLGSWPPTANLNHYICAWDATPGSVRPTMFRITIELIDADGRLNSPRVVQYIVPVAQ